MKPIIVMAGTPVDTRMGMDCLSSHGLTGLFCPVSENPNQQTAFQISPMEKKAAAVTALLRTAQAEHGCGKAFIYCNSLSSSVDFGPIARETGLKIVTPLDMYRQLAPRYHSLAVEETTLPGEFEILARTDDGEIMAMKHKEYPLIGIQFHPESIYTDHGKKMVENFLKM